MRIIRLCLYYIRYFSFTSVSLFDFYFLILLETKIFADASLVVVVVQVKGKLFTRKIFLPKF